jgi:hypothetical protein
MNLLALLKRLEWTAESGAWVGCPECGVSDAVAVHAPECEIKAAIDVLEQPTRRGMMDLIHEMKVYHVVTDDEGRRGSEREPVSVAANSLAEALAIASAISGPPVKGVVLQGRLFLDVHKLPEAKG